MRVCADPTDTSGLLTTLDRTYPKIWIAFCLRGPLKTPKAKKNDRGGRDDGQFAKVIEPQLVVCGIIWHAALNLAMPAREFETIIAASDWPLHAVRRDQQKYDEGTRTEGARSFFRASK